MPYDQRPSAALSSTAELTRRMWRRLMVCRLWARRRWRVSRMRAICSPVIAVLRVECICFNSVLLGGGWGLWPRVHAAYCNGIADAVRNQFQSRGRVGCWIPLSASHSSR